MYTSTLRRYPLFFLSILIRLQCFGLTSLPINKFKHDPDSSTLRQLFIVYRHGDRNPITLYPTDPNPASKFPEGLGELTNRGKEEHYELGKFFRRRYKNFLTNDLQEIEIRSSDANRCLDSAECNLAGIYPPDDEVHIWNKDLIWQPVPIHTRPQAQDPVCTTDSDCPEYAKELERIRQRPDIQEFLAKHQQLFHYMTNNTGSTVNDWQSAGYIFDTLYIESLYNLTIPDWAKPIWNEMRDVEDYGFYVPFSSQLARRLRGGPLLGDIISKMENKVTKQLPQLTKVFMYSTHDIVIAALLSAMDIFNNLSPPYCSTVLIELHENGPHNHTVRIYYRNITEFDPSFDDKLIPLTVPGCEWDCPLGHFIRLTQDSVPIDLKEECGIVTPQKTFSNLALSIISGMGFILFLLILSIGVMLWLRCQKEKSGIRYQRVGPEDNN